MLDAVEENKGFLYKHSLDSECRAYLEVWGRKRVKITNTSGDMLKNFNFEQQNSDSIWL